LNGVLLASEFVNHVVSHGAVFVDSLLGAVLDLANFWVGRTFNLLAQDSATEQPEHSGRSATRALTHAVTDSATGNSAHSGTRTRFLTLYHDLLGGTDLAWNGDLLDDGGGRDDFADFLRLHVAQLANETQRNEAEKLGM
jgi:hypothetical protein